MVQQQQQGDLNDMDLTASPIERIDIEMNVLLKQNLARCSRWQLYYRLFLHSFKW